MAGIFKSYIAVCSNRRILIVLTIMILSSSAFPQWTRTNGPEGVAVSTLANINGTIYAGTEVNGVYSSTDDGLIWVARNSGIETYGISAIIGHQGYIFAGTFGGGVYRSSDGGITWAPPSNGNTLFITSLVFNDPYIYAGAGFSGLYRSSDNGVTWTEVSSFYYVDEMCVSGNKLFVSEFNYTYSTTDNGVTWSEVQQLTGASVFSFHCSGDTILVGARNEIYRSTNNGVSFTQIVIPFNFSIVNIYSIASMGSTVFAATSYDGVYKSTDFGLNWIPSNQGMGPKDVRALTLTDASSLIAGTHYVGMYRSTDLGTFWNKSQSGFPAGASILCLLESESSIYAGTRDGVLRTDNNGETWLKMGGTNDTTMYSDIWAMCEHNGVIYASMQLYFDATIYKSTDKGSTWIRCGMVGLPFGLSFIKGLEGSGNNLVAGTDEGIYYSPDGGENWYPTSVPNINVASLASSGNYVYAAVPSGAGVYRSADNGVSWSVSLQSTVDYVEVAAKDNYAYAGAFFGGARYSSSYGGSWSVCNGFPSGASIFELAAVGDGMVLAGTDLSPNWIYVSNDYGNYFTPYSEGLFENASVEAFAVNETFMFAGTDYNGVWRRYLPGVPVELTSFTATTDENKVSLFWKTETETNNSGFEVQRTRLRSSNFAEASWERIGFVEGNGTTTEENNYLFVDENLTAGKYQYRLKQIDYDGSFEFSDIVEVEILTPIEFSLAQNYPNPFNPSTTIEYSMPESGNVKLEVYNSLGEEVATLVNDYKEAGIYKVNFDARNLASGIYFYKIDAGNFFLIKKMILLR
jgi:photosystem II stability/assembly factor-like uncharacterized protein